MTLLKSCGRLYLCLLITIISLLLAPGFAMANSQSELIIGRAHGASLVPQEALLDDLATVRVIYLGEIFHTIARHHARQAGIAEGTLAEQDLKLVLGMEMFSVEQQPVLDKWQRSSDDVEALIKELGTEHWTNLKAYEAVLLSARDRGIPIIGLNASEPSGAKARARGTGRALSGGKRESA